MQRSWQIFVALACVPLLGGALIKVVDPLDYELLAKQIKLQTKLAWDIDQDIPWHLGIDNGKYLLPLDDQAIAFPGASPEQELALSQWMGLVVNSTISEMEDALPKLKFAGWERLLKDFPANPELRTLGELFFEEEAKHARAFSRYLDLFCDQINLDRHDLDALMPKAFGSFFQRAITSNALTGGHAFWWIVASVEEISISIYHQIYKNREGIDPLYYQLHRRHLEEESRHANYAFFMLHLVNMRPASMRQLLHKKTDFLFAQMVGAPWVVTELFKFFDIKKLQGSNPFFATLASCIPLFEKLTKRELAMRMFFAAPYVSWFLNPSWRHQHQEIARSHGAIVPPFPKPKTAKLAIRSISGDDVNDKAS